MSEFFSRETLDFLAENRMRNDKTWFNEHKDIYNASVVAPLVSLAGRLTAVLSEIDGKLSAGSVSRVWRDARFSKDKSLFRDSMWISVVRKKNEGLPEFFFVITPSGFLYGCGYYQAGTASMDEMRKLILSGDEAFKSALSACENQNIFEISGEFYKKPRYSDMPENILNWLNRKNICLERDSDDFDLLFSEKLFDVIAEGFKILAPVYKFFIKAEESKL